MLTCRTVCVRPPAAPSACSSTPALATRCWLGQLYAALEGVAVLPTGCCADPGAVLGQCAGRGTSFTGSNPDTCSSSVPASCLMLTPAPAVRLLPAGSTVAAASGEVGVMPVGTGGRWRLNVIRDTEGRNCNGLLLLLLPCVSACTDELSMVTMLTCCDSPAPAGTGGSEGGHTSLLPGASMSVPACSNNPAQSTGLHEATPASCKCPSMQMPTAACVLCDGCCMSLLGAELLVPGWDMSVATAGAAAVDAGVLSSAVVVALPNDVPKPL
jgi:hypothetical protein